MLHRTTVWIAKLAMTALLTAASCAAPDDGSLRRPVTDNSGSMTGGAGQAGAAGNDGSTGNAGTGGRAGVAGGGGSGGTGGAAGVGRSDGGAAGGASGSTGTGGSSGKPLGTFFDDFEDGNATSPSWIDADPSLGGMWSVVSPDVGNHVFAQSAAVSDWVIAVSGDYRWSNQVVEAKVKFTSAPGMIGIFARLLDTRNYYFLYLDGSNVILRKRVNNSSTNILKVKIEAVIDTWYTLRLSVIGTMLAGYLDGTMIVSATDTDLATGGIAVGTSDGATGAFDDVTVTVP